MEWKTESELFNQMADYYDTYRPGYPNDIIETIIRKANLTVDSKLLEIGSGSGKATAQFVDIGLDIICIEPGADLVEKGRKTFQDKRVTFVNQRFEDYAEPYNYFDAIISAQAFHWIPQPQGYEKCARALKKRGKIALFWNIDIIRDTETDNAFYDILSQYNAFTSCVLEKNYNNRVKTISSAIVESGLFLEPEIIQSFWDKNYSADEYFNYILTGQVFVQNSDEQKRDCYDNLIQFAEKYNGIQRHYVCELYIAEKR